MATYCTIPTIWNSGKGKYKEIANRPVVAQDFGGGTDKRVKHAG